MSTLNLSEHLEQLELVLKNMRTNNSIIQGLWVGNELSIMEQLSIKSFLANGHEYHLYVYDEVKNIPEGAVVKDGNEILAKDKVFTYQVGWGKGSYAGFADLFRYCLLNEKGGWWADTDIVCLKRFDFEAEYVVASSYEGKWGEPANNCVLKMPVHSHLGNHLIQEICKKNLNEVKFGETGPHLVQKAVADLNLEQCVVSHQIFCPISWRAVQKIAYSSESMNFEKTIRSCKDFVRAIIRPHTSTGRITKNSFAVHLWNEIWRQNGLSKDEKYDPNCLYERLKRRYL